MGVSISSSGTMRYNTQTTIKMVHVSGGLSYRGKVQYPRAVLYFLNGRMGLMYMQCIEVGSWVDCPITSYEVVR